ncbi:MAG: haloacid dehalogenase [Chloroflexota bacterium]|nr:haloacid dehalogenase [Chloroflexota bacterium]
MIRHSAQAIRATHRGEHDISQSIRENAHKLLQEVNETLATYGDLLSGGFVHDAQKEYAEACITAALVTNNPIPTPQVVGVNYPAYLNGMGEAAGELRRHLLDSMRTGSIEHCEVLLSYMDDIYNILVTMDFPDAITGGLRRTTDVVRGILEKTRGDLTLTVRQRELEARLTMFIEHQ